MNKQSRSGAGGIFVVGGIAVGSLLLMPEGSGFFDSGPPPPPPIVLPPLPPGASLGNERGTGGSAIDVTAPAPLPTYEPSPPPPPEGSWEAVKPAARLGALGPVGAAIGRGLNELKDEIDVCFDEDVQARHGPLRVTRTQDGSPIEEDGQNTILMLQLEAQQGSVEIVDAPIETQGSAGEGLVACVQRILRGRSVEVQGVKDGQRYRVPFRVSQ